MIRFATFRLPALLLLTAGIAAAASATPDDPPAAGSSGVDEVVLQIDGFLRSKSGAI